MGEIVLAQLNALAASERLSGRDNRRGLRLPGRRVLVLLAITALTLGVVSATDGSAQADDEWGKPVTVDSTFQEYGINPTIAMAKDGSKALAVWRSNDIHAAWWTPSGWSEVTRLGEGGFDSDTTPSVALSADGNKAVVVWDRADEEDPVPSYYSVQWVQWTGTAWTPQTTLAA
ncbi:MAG: hypothetical protein K0U64_00185, partial [Actinomycetia bacterium]|nr:hypothetical protein [Actinomycetes bacterium]